MYKALIVGAGAIASGYDEPDSKEIRTHAHAYIKNPNIELLGFYDVDYKKAEIAAVKWGVKAFKKLQNADIISICVPDEYHTKMVLEAEKLNPKVIFLEKPICRDKKDIEILKEVKTPILVNYTRSFCKEFQNLSKRIKKGEFGEFQSGFGYYGKGFIHNGSHMVNLLNLLFGDTQKCETISEINDFYDDDYSKTVVLTFENNAKFTMNAVDCRDYSVFELDLIFKKARIKILNIGNIIEIYLPEKSKKYKGYTMLKLSETIKTDMDFALKNAVSNIVDYLDNKADLICTLNDGIKAVMYG